MEKMDIFALVDELQEEIDMSPTRGFSKNKSVDAKIVMEIISDIKSVLHEELDASRRIMAEREQIINAAESQALEIIKRAKKDAEDLMKKEDVYKAAYERAAKLLENSKLKAQDLRKSANSYAEEVFDELENYYRDSIELINVNRTRLYGRSDPTITPKSEGELA